MKDILEKCSTSSPRKSLFLPEKGQKYLHCNVSPPLVGKVLPIYMYITSKPFLGFRDIQIYSHLRSSFLEKLVERDHKSPQKKKVFYSRKHSRLTKERKHASV